MNCLTDRTSVVCFSNFSICLSFSACACSYFFSRSAPSSLKASTFCSAAVCTSTTLPLLQANATGDSSRLPKILDRSSRSLQLSVSRRAEKRTASASELTVPNRAASASTCRRRSTLRSSDMFHHTELDKRNRDQLSTYLTTQLWLLPLLLQV